MLLELDQQLSSAASFVFDTLLSKFRLPLLQRYILREVAGPFWMSLLVFTGILFLVRSLKLIDLVVNKNVPVGDMLLLFACIIPRFLEIAIPMSLLIGIILAFSRLSSASELVVIRASGISLKELSRAVFFFACFTFLFSLSIACWIRPWANHRLGVGMFEIAKREASAGLIAGVFNDLGLLTLYAETVDNQNGQLEKVIISDRRSPDQSRIFVARHGQIVSDDTMRTLSLRLYDGTIHEGAAPSYNVTYFDINNINMGQSELAEGSGERSGEKANEMSIASALTSLHRLSDKPEPRGEKDVLRLASLQVEVHRRFAVPTICLCVAIIAMALGVQPSRGGKSWAGTANVFVGIMVILFYYLFFAFAEALGQHAVAPVWFLMWLPNILFAGIALVLFNAMETEEWLNLSNWFGASVNKLAARLRVVDREHPGREHPHKTDLELG